MNNRKAPEGRTSGAREFPWDRNSVWYCLERKGHGGTGELIESDLALSKKKKE